jgi:hypothetical protein
LPVLKTALLLRFFCPEQQNQVYLDNHTFRISDGYRPVKVHKQMSFIDNSIYFSAISAYKIEWGGNDLAMGESFILKIVEEKICVLII